MAFRKSAALIAKGEQRAAELLAQANLNAEAARERLALDVKDLEDVQRRIPGVQSSGPTKCSRSLSTPRRTRRDDEDAWRSWYYELIGYRYTPPPKVMVAQNGTLDLPTPGHRELLRGRYAGPTREGTRPIESIRTGDQVLSQDVTTGALAFRTVMAVHHNPPDKTLRVALDNGDAVVASRFHRFWLAGIGWAMARDLKPGDIVRTLAGPARVALGRRRPRSSPSSTSTSPSPAPTSSASPRCWCTTTPCHRPTRPRPSIAQLILTAPMNDTIIGRRCFRIVLHFFNTGFRDHSRPGMINIG